MTHGPVSRAGDGFFMDCWVCRLTATGAGGANAAVKARQARTRIAFDNAITLVATSVPPRPKTELMSRVTGSGNPHETDPPRSKRTCFESLHAFRRLVAEASVPLQTRRDAATVKHKQETLHKSAYPRSSNGMWSIKLFAPSGTSSSSPSKSGVNTS